MARLEQGYFGEGLVTDAEPMAIRPGACDATGNTVFDDGVVAVRPGRVLHDAVADTVVALCEFHDPTNRPYSQDTLLLAACVDETTRKGKLYVSDTTGQTFSATKFIERSGLVLEIQDQRDAPPQMAQFKDHVYLLNGVDNTPVYKIFNVTSDVTWTYNSFDAEYGVSTAYTPHRILVSDDHLTIYVLSPLAVHKYTSGDAGVTWTWQGFYGWNGTSADYFTTGTPTTDPTGSTDGAFTKAIDMAFSVDKAYIYVLDSAKKNVTSYKLTDGTMAIAVAKTDFLYAPDKTTDEDVCLALMHHGELGSGLIGAQTIESFALENSIDSVEVYRLAVDSAGRIIVAAFFGYKGVIYTDGGPVMGGSSSIYYPRNQTVICFDVSPSTTVDEVHYLPNDTIAMTPGGAPISDLLLVRVDDNEYYLHSEDTLYTLDMTATPATRIAVPTIVGGISRLGLYNISYEEDNLYACFTDRVSLMSGATELYRYGMGGTGANDLQVARDAAVDADGKLYIIDSGNQRVVYMTITSGTQINFDILADMPAPAQAPTITDAADASGVFAPGTHEFLYTFAKLVNPGEYRESVASPIATERISVQSNLTVQTRSAGAVGMTSGNDVVRIYYRNGVETGEFFRYVGTATIPVTGDPAAVLITSIDLYSDTYDPYVQVPPTGCTYLMEWQGRMAYTLKDELYLSQWDNADRTFPIDTVVSPDTVSGASVRIGLDGGHITGLGKIGAYLVVMKRRGIWLVSGNPGAADFAVQQISTSNGCIAHNTVQQVGGNLLVWLDHNRVWGFDGQGFTDLSKDIAPNIALYSEAQQQAAFAVYDPVKKWYVLTMPVEGGLGVRG